MKTPKTKQYLKDLEKSDLCIIKQAMIRGIVQMKNAATKDQDWGFKAAVTDHVDIYLKIIAVLDTEIDQMNLIGDGDHE